MVSCHVRLPRLRGRAQGEADCIPRCRPAQGGFPRTGVAKLTVGKGCPRLLRDGDGSSGLRPGPSVRLTSAGIVKHLTARAGDIRESRSMSLLTTSIDSIHLTRWNLGLGALTLLGVFAIALALILP